MALTHFKSFGHLLCTLSLSVNICLMFSHDLNEIIHFRPGYHRDDVLFLLCLIEELIILICLVGDINFNHLVMVVSAGFFHGNRFSL